MSCAIYIYYHLGLAEYMETCNTKEILTSHSQQTAEEGGAMTGWGPKS